MAEVLQAEGARKDVTGSVRSCYPCEVRRFDRAGMLMVWLALSHLGCSEGGQTPAEPDASKAAPGTVRMASRLDEMIRSENPLASPLTGSPDQRIARLRERGSRLWWRQLTAPRRSTPW